MAGLMPSAPLQPTIAVTVRVLEAYRIMHCRCPQLAILSFFKSLCDIHQVEFQSYLTQQFSIAYDLYLDILRRCDRRVLDVLGRDSPSWRMKNACPACMYELEGEDNLIFRILTAMDGNDSLKRILRRDKDDRSKSSELRDDRDAGDGFFLTREKVDRWAKDGVAQMLPMAPNEAGKKSPCTDKWQNMIHDIFLCLCRHGFALLVVDMIQSRELSKYPLAISYELMKHLGERLGAGYDVACHFETTVFDSELGDEACKKCFSCLVPAFHGHAHNRFCQVYRLANYRKGMGLEDLETCERYFSHSNGLAKSCRYSSCFHRQQEISTYMKRFDNVETYANLSKFLCSNYWQAIGILKTEHIIGGFLKQEGLQDESVFEKWLEEERKVLRGLKSGAAVKPETLEMEYVQKLMALESAKELRKAAHQSRSDDAAYSTSKNKAEIAARHAKEKVDRALQAVQDLEVALVLTPEERWKPDSEEWTKGMKEVLQRKFLVAVNALESVVVQRIFELMKMNQSGTGYKLRKHIAKSLQARSKAVRNALERYNRVLQKNTLNIIYTQKALNLLSLTVSITGIRAASWGSIGYTEQPD
ncbi:hypothetical protein FB45DRAFT_982293 [Roridomyces roridus]|uniref:Uncharacterized protein n=1 Tax=Roridomyces roridus TaxID=1738132 RepID=A0AAD7B4P1_9AGAR|nr:hypothetical protein FB45DRAFT_982293 [Roridomyces roridus]